MWLAIGGFLVHLALIFLTRAEWVVLPPESRLLGSPIAAIYTPFSFILLYEVYLLIYYLPHSISTYIGKQYEIVALIVIRRIFKDISNLDLTTEWFSNPDDLQFTYDVVSTVLLFALILVFYWLNKRRHVIEGKGGELTPKLQRFIRIKTGLAMVLIPVFIGLAVYTLGDWLLTIFSDASVERSLYDLNTIFFDEFFSVLIVTDVLLLLVSLIHTDRFRKVIRNSGFIISTILIKLSFSAVGLLNAALTTAAVLFGVLILGLHNLYARLEND